MDDLQKVYQLLMPRLQASANLEKHADDQALTTKVATDVVTLGLLKRAASPLTKGLMYGAGAAIPAGLVGAGLISHAGRESRKSIEDARNKALQAAAGIAAIGGGLYALHRHMGPSKGQERYASVKEDSGTLIEKLATVAFLDEIFEYQRTTGAEEARQKAAACQMLNAEHGVDLLRQLLD